VLRAFLELHGPAVLVCEDLQWFDSASWTALCALTDTDWALASLLLVASFRPGPLLPAWAGGSSAPMPNGGLALNAELRDEVAATLRRLLAREEGMASLPLAPLSLEDTRALVSAALGGVEVHPPPPRPALTRPALLCAPISVWAQSRSAAPSLRPHALGCHALARPGRRGAHSRRGVPALPARASGNTSGPLPTPGALVRPQVGGGEVAPL
jgi:hypothetical protein